MLNKLTKPDLLRACLYSITIVLGTFTAFNELDQAKIDNFWRFIGICILLLFIELFTGIYYRHAAVQTRLPELDEHLRFVQITYHFVLPLAMYGNLLAFTYFSPQPELRAAILISLFLSLTMLFINIRAYYSHRRAIEHQTHAIYDILKFIIIFTGSAAMIAFARSGQNYVYVFFMLLVLMLVLSLLFVVRQSTFGMLELAVAVVFSLIVSAFASWLGANTEFSHIVIGLVATLGFYITTATLHHLLQHNLTWRITSEYALIAIMVLIILFGVNAPAT